MQKTPTLTYLSVRPNIARIRFLEMIGQTLGHCRIVEKIGVGRMGEVSRAHDHQLDCNVALKVLPPGTTADETTRELFRKEALAPANLNHPNIETVFEFNTQDGKDFLAMELIPGSSLRESAQTRTACWRSCISPG